MVSSQKGKFLLLYFLLMVYFQSISSVFGNSILAVTETESEYISEYKPEISDALDLLNKQQVQLEKLEELVKNLTELVSRLESQFPEYSKIKSLVDKEQEIKRVVEKVEVDKGKGDGDQLIEKKIVDENLESKVKDGGEKVGAVSVTKFSSFWSERFQFVSAMKLGSNPTCISVLPFTDFEGLAKYVAVGDDVGRVYLISRNGDVQVEFSTMSESPVTAVLSYLSIYKNESVLVTGHEDGVILVHRVWEDSNEDEWDSLHMEAVVKFDRYKEMDNGAPITILEVHNIGQKRYILSMDLSGTIIVFRENGTVYGKPVAPVSRPRAFLKQRLLFLTETGAGSLDLRTMKIRESPCEGLNNSKVESYVFDATERSKAYGFTTEGNLIHVLLLGDIMNFKCRVRSRRKFDMGEPLAFQAIKGYLLVANQDKVFVYNVSSQHYVRAGGPKLMFSAELGGISASFVTQEQMNAGEERKLPRPIIASDREKLVILSTGGGFLGIYRSNLPVFKNEFNTMQWTSPILFFILFLFGAWHFFANKKEALTSWGPDEPFTSTSVTNTAPLGTGNGSADNRSFIDSSRNTDMVDLRGNDVRGLSRRYASPPRYPRASANPCRPPPPPPADANSMSTSVVDPNFRNTQEIKYRGQI